MKTIKQNLVERLSEKITAARKISDVDGLKKVLNRMSVKTLKINLDK